MPIDPLDCEPGAAAISPKRELRLVLGGGLALILAFACLFALAARRTERRGTVAVVSRTDREPSGRYAGSRVCAECHPGESAAYARSGHARTLRTPAGHSVSRWLDGRKVLDPERPRVSWSYLLRDGALRVDRAEDGAVESFDVHYAVGSGHHATTLLSITDPAVPTAFEHRLTHFTRDDMLHITPGQTAGNPSAGTTPYGRNLNAAETIKCFSCHTTITSASGRDRLDLGEIIPNVSCERCHGPARNHVADARAGRSKLSMPFGLDNWTADSQMSLCGQCHRHPWKAPPGRITPEDPALARFQPVGLMMSRCYQKSGGMLSCVNCHDPHSRASSDRISYEPACLKCHQSAPQATCPKSPRSGCIDCHMPKVDSGQRILFSDHWIRVRG